MIENNYLVLNLGTLFFMFILLLTIPVCLILTKPCRCWSWYNKKHEAMSTSIKGNTWIRFIMEGCLDISICATVNYIFIKKSNEGLKWNSTFHIINSTAIIVLVTLIIAFTIWTPLFYLRNFEKWKDEKFEEKYG